MLKESHSQVREKAFWKKFCKGYWEKKPLLIQDSISPQLQIGEEHLFILLVRYSDYCRKTRTAPGFKLYVEGESQYLEQVLQFLPELSDKTLLGYHARMSKWFPDYCLVCDELITVNWEKWDELGDFLQTLYAEVGIPNRYTEMGLYLGNYRKTPFGVHVDGCGVLSIPVIGKKKFRLWTSSFVKSHPEIIETHEYQEFKKQSQLLEVNPGQMSYWPSTYWHIAESDKSFTATWSLGLWVDEPYLDLLVEGMKPMLRHQLGSDADATTIKFKKRWREDGYVAALPPIIDRSVTQLSSITSQEWRDRLLKLWLEKLSRHGFKSAPMPKKVKEFSPVDLIQGNAENPILWAKLANGDLCLAVNGSLLEVPNTAENVMLVQILNSGKLIQVKALTSLSDGRAVSQKALKILQRLHQLGYTKIIN